MKRIQIEVGGVNKWAWAEKSKGTLWVHFEGRTFEYSEKKSSRGSAKSEIHKNEIHAPMPGKILSVKVCIDEEVIAGTTAIVMEAMKMEYSLEVGVFGKVAELNCKEGDQVTKDQLLLRVEE